MNSLAVDVGKARIGVAFNVGELVLAHGVLPRDENAAGQIAEISRERGAERTFVGLPLSLSGEHTGSTTDALHFARELAAAGLKVFLVDERLTTKSASGNLRQAGIDSKRGKSIVDAESARIILETALHSHLVKPLEEFNA